MVFYLSRKSRSDRCSRNTRALVSEMEKFQEQDICADDRGIGASQKFKERSIYRLSCTASLYIAIIQKHLCKVVEIQPLDPRWI
jgi:hypothetical protein